MPYIKVVKTKNPNTIFGLNCFKLQSLILVACPQKIYTRYPNKLFNMMSCKRLKALGIIIILTLKQKGCTRALGWDLDELINLSFETCENAQTNTRRW
jgi:hypothetical protein